MKKEYVSDYSVSNRCFCVFEKLTSSIKVFHEKCENKKVADERAKELNEEQL